MIMHDLYRTSSPYLFKMAHNFAILQHEISDSWETPLMCQIAMGHLRAPDNYSVRALESALTEVTPLAALTSR